MRIRRGLWYYPRLASSRTPYRMCLRMCPSVPSFRGRISCSRWCPGQSLDTHDVRGEYAPGGKVGGVLDHQLWEIVVEALPTARPSVREIDGSALGIGDQARIEDMRIPEGVKILNEPEAVVVSILAPEMEEEEEEEELLEGEEGLEVPEVGEEEEGQEPGEDGAKAEAGGEED